MSAIAKRVTAIIEAVESPAITRAAAEAMSRAVEAELTPKLGGNLSMSRFAEAGPVRIKESSRTGLAEVVVSGAVYTLAKRGRRPGRAASGRRYPGARALGVDVTVALDEGLDAARSAVRKAIG